MNIASLTIEIWEMILIVALVFSISIFSANFNNADLSQAAIYANQINYIGYLSENKNLIIKIKVDDKTKIEKINNNYQIKVNKKVSKKLIPINLISIKQEGNILIIS